MKNYRVIIFDWDGTLCDSAAQIIHSVQQACVGLNLAVPEADKVRVMIGSSLTEIVKVLHPGLSNNEIEQWIHHFRAYHSFDPASTLLFDGVRETLDELQRRQFEFAVATGKSKPRLEQAITATGLTGMFAAYRTADQCPSKPNPQMLLEIMEELGATPAETIMIGDTDFDLEAANHAGIDSIGVSYGNHPESQLAACNPLKIIHDFRELSAFFHKGICTNRPDRYAGLSD